MRDDRYVHRDDIQNCWYKNFCDKYGTDACTSHCKKFTQTDYLFQMSNLPKSMWKAQDLDTSSLSDEVINSLDVIRADIEFFVKKGFNLYLFGKPGTGKTSWAVKLMNNYFAQVAETTAYNTRGLYVSVPSFLRDAKLNMTYKSEDYREFLREIQNCDVVIWDDIGQTDPTQYESQWLYSYINERMFSKKCNIFTSNLTPNELRVMDHRLESRVCGSSDCLCVSGPDRRKRNTYAEFLNSLEMSEDDTASSSEQDTES